MSRCHWENDTFGMAVCRGATLQKKADSGKPSDNSVTDETPLFGIADAGEMATLVNRG